MKLKNKTVLIFGGGRYGTKAVKFAKKRNVRRVIVVDNNSYCSARKFLSTDEFIPMRKSGILNLIMEIKPDFIIPAMPGHTAGRLFREVFNLKPFPEGLAIVVRYLPQSLISRKDRATSTLVLSYMSKEKTCREDCIPPDEYCRLTKEPRPAPVYALLNYAIFRKFDINKIFVSEQISVGLGGIRTEIIIEFLNKVKKELPQTLAIGTACQCHGILNLFKMPESIRDKK